MAGQAAGFEYRSRGNDVVITHQGRHAATLRGARAAQFLDDLQNGDPQALMARITGDYKHGNERVARNHPRNRRR